MRLSALALALLMLNGCATNDYAMYVEAQRSIAESQSRANIARYQMLGELVKTGDPTTKAIAAAGLLMGNQNGQQTPAPQQINAPVTASEMAYRWGSIVLPFLGGVWAVKQGADVAKNASNNAAAVSMNTNGTMAAISKSGIDGMSAGAASNSSSLVNLGTAGFNSLTTLGQSGLTNLNDLGKNSNSSLVTLGTAGINGTSAVGQSGITGAVTLGQAGITGTSTVGQSGITGAVTLGTAGITGTSTVGQAGINGVNHAVDSFIPALPAP